MKFAPADILRELGVTLTKATINLPVAASELLTRLSNLRQRLEEAIAAPQTLLTRAYPLILR